MYSCTANGPVIFLMSYTSQFHRSAALVPIRLRLICIQIIYKVSIYIVKIDDLMIIIENIVDSSWACLCTSQDL